jgi:hypothetical protein
MPGAAALSAGVSAGPARIAAGAAGEVDSAGSAAPAAWLNAVAVVAAAPASASFVDEAGAG